MGETDIPPHEDLEVRLRFEALLADLSAGFVNLPPDKVDGAVIDAQRRICECFDLDRSALWQVLGPEPGPWLLTHFHQVPARPLITGGPMTERSFGEDGAAEVFGNPPVELHGDALTLFPWVTAQVRRGETVVIPDVENLPVEAAQDQAMFRQVGTQATVVIPLLAGGAVSGTLAFGSMRTGRTWPQALVSRFHLITQVFASALARKHAELRLRESEARLSLAATAGGAGLWEVDLPTGRGWFSPDVREMYGFSASEELTFESLVARVHPDDRDARQERFRAAIDDGSAYVSEYRILLPDGRIRWAHVRGHSYAAVPGSPTKLMGVTIDVTERKQAEEQLRQALEDLRRLRDQLEQENVYLRAEMVDSQRQAQIGGHSPAILRTLEQAQQVALTASTVLLIGETGTGKERFAALIHESGARRNRPMVKVNCAAIPATLIESELFGREKGAYTGALSRQIGRFELAHLSTLFLDEIGDLPAEVQVKLLRVLEEKQVERLGSPRPIPVDVRIIAATNQDLEAAVRAGRFREDLYYRLNVFPIIIPPLRERREDIPILAQLFVEEFATSMGKRVDAIAERSMDELVSHGWPGNVRELRNVIERAMILATGRTLKVGVPQTAVAPAQVAGREMKDVERTHILTVLEQAGWRIRGPRGAARILGLKPTTLETRMARLGIHRPDATRKAP
jgi:formate hydrogenlyase transcriptional activator